MIYYYYSDGDKMSGITLLKHEQLFGRKKLDVFKYNGVAASITDFAILLGGYVNHSLNPQGERNVSYFTKTARKDYIIFVSTDGHSSELHGNFKARTIGSRLVLPIASIEKDLPSLDREKSDLSLEVSYGEYPQKACDKDFQLKLEELYKSNLLNKTGKSYTVDSRKYYEYDFEFLKKQYEEYEYNGKKYIRVIANTAYVTLSNGKVYNYGDVAWVEVNPIKWLVDTKTKLMVAKHILFAGIQFDNGYNYKFGFNKTNLGKYIKNIFSKDIIPSKIKSVKKEVSKKETNLTTEQEIIILEEEIESKFIKLEISGLFSDKVNNLRKEYEQIIGKIENNPTSILVDGTDLSLNVEHIFTYKIQLQRLLDKVNDLINKLEMEISLSKENDSASLIKNYYKIKGELSLQEQEKIKDDLSETLYNRIKHEIISDNSSETFDILNDDFKTKIYILFLKEVKEYLKSVENKNSKFLLNILDREFTVDEIEQFLEITGQYLFVPKFNNNRK